MDVRDVEVWQLVDQRLDEVRRLPYDELLRRTRSEPEEELLERPSGGFRRRTRVIALPNDRLGIRVRVDVDGRPPRTEGGIVITSDGALAPEVVAQRRAAARQSVRARPWRDARGAAAVRPAAARVLPARLNTPVL